MYFLAYLLTDVLEEVPETVPLINVPIRGLPLSIRVMDPSDSVYSLRGTCFRISTYGYKVPVVVPAESRV